MSLLSFRPESSVVVRAFDAETETVGRPPTRVQLLVDSSATGGALSTVRVTLGRDAEELYDTSFLQGSAWDAARAANVRAT